MRRGPLRVQLDRTFECSLGPKRVEPTLVDQPKSILDRRKLHILNLAQRAFGFIVELERDQRFGRANLLQRGKLGVLTRKRTRPHKHLTRALEVIYKIGHIVRAHITRDYDAARVDERVRENGLQPGRFGNAARV